MNPSQTPAGGWRYLDPDTGYTVKSAGRLQLFADARKHREANGLPIPDEFETLIETWLCRQAAPGVCVYLDGRGLGGSLCVHRGDVVRLVVCESCGGTIKGKVNACAVHGEATTFTKEIGVRFCGTCPDRLDPD